MPLLAGQNVLTSYTDVSAVYGSDSGEWTQSFVAVATGVATSISIYLSDWNTTTNARLRLRDAAGNLLDEATIAVADGTGTVTATLSGGATITSGQTYILSFTPDTGYIIPFNNANTYVIEQVTASTYAAAEDPLSAGTAVGSGEVAIWVESSGGPAVTSVDTDNIVVIDQGYLVATVTGVPVSTDYGLRIEDNETVFVLRDADVFLFSLTDAINDLTPNAAADDPATQGQTVEFWYGDL